MNRAAPVAAGVLLLGLPVLGALTDGEPALIVHDQQTPSTPPPATTAPTVAVGPPPAPPSPTVGQAAATVGAAALRGPQMQIAATLPPPPSVPSGLNGLPFAPAGLEGCDEMEWYRRQAGLVDHFDGLGFRESSCRNDVSSFCCHGYWQLYVTLHLRDHRLAPRYARCGITGVADVLGPEPIEKQRNACGAAAVYAVSGGGAWDAW